MSDLDIIALVLAEHESFRRQFAALGQLEDTEKLAEAWQELADQLEVHASAEEEMLYPRLLAVEDESVDSVDETDDAIRDHNDIRDTAHAATHEQVGTDAWWDAVHKCQEANEHHLSEEENDVLPDLRNNVAQDDLDALGESWLAFHEEHDRARGLSGDDLDPEAYVAEHSPSS